jgi:hypothetical protein
MVNRDNFEKSFIKKVSAGDTVLISELFDQT